MNGPLWEFQFWRSIYSLISTAWPGNSQTNQPIKSVHCDSTHCMRHTGGMRGSWRNRWVRENSFHMTCSKKKKVGPWVRNGLLHVHYSHRQFKSLSHVVLVLRLFEAVKIWNDVNKRGKTTYLRMHISRSPLLI